MKTLAIIGAGSSGIQSCCHFLAHLSDEWQVSLIHDPAMPGFGIGESTNGTFVSALKAGLHFDIEKDLAALDGTIKLVTKYERWREEDFCGPLLTHGNGQVAIHFNTFKLKEFALPRLKEIWGDKFQVVEGSVSTLVDNGSNVTINLGNDTITVDYVMDSMGFPEDFNDYWVLKNPILNHGLVHNVAGDGSEWKYTGHRATVDGWMFQVPLTTRISHGYMFNDNITSVETAKENFAAELGISVDNLDNIEYKFGPFYAKTLVTNRIVKNGNKALFFEPMFGNSLWNYDVINRIFFDYITAGLSEVDANYRFFTHACSLKDMIYFKYHGGSLYNTEFWKRTKEISSEKLTESNFFANAVYYMKKLNASTDGSLPGFFWAYGDAGLNIVDKVFGYNYFKNE